MCQQLRCSYQELQDLPEDVYLMWLSFLDGEGQARSERSATPHGS